MKYRSSCTFLPHIYDIGKLFKTLFFPIFSVSKLIFAYVRVFLFSLLLANKCLQNLKLYKNSQSIVITGITGSGKTETAKHAINFLCQQTCVENILNVNPILEAFGNAKTRDNQNSSRFCKFIEVICRNVLSESV